MEKNVGYNSNRDENNEISSESQKLLSSDKIKTQNENKSPTFKVFNCKPPHQFPFSSRSLRSNSPDFEIPSYQINQSVSSKKTNNKSDNDSSDIFLPFTPVFSPISVFNKQFQPPSIHSLGTIAKKCNVNLFNSNSCSSSDEINIEEKRKQGPFKSLQMADKDISWASYMASPPPKPPFSQFNTIEKATFFPEEKFQKVRFFQFTIY